MVVLRIPPCALGQVLTIFLCCIISFYYDNLYDFRIFRSFGALASRLGQSLDSAFILIATLNILLPPSANKNRRTAVHRQTLDCR